MASNLKGLTARERDTSIFVGGIIGKVTERDIRLYFETFGPIHSVTLIPKKNNRKLNSGYCFISFRDSHTKWKVLSQLEHFLCGRKINCKSLLKGSQLKDEKLKNTSRKLCVKYLPADTTEEEFEKFFGSYGVIHSYYLVNYNNNANSTSCNGFIIYKDDAVFRKLLDQKYITFRQRRLKIERYVKHFERETSQTNTCKHNLSTAIEIGPLSSLKPTNSSYYQQYQSRMPSDPVSNLRFNILLNPYSEEDKGYLRLNVSTAARLWSRMTQVRPALHE
jgi:RNA recognition motif-containing protein